MKEEQFFDLIVVGGGASGFFGAINAATIKPSLKILILEKSNKLLTKVRISGGGRCNVTHHCFEPTQLSKHYPRGQKELKKLFRAFQASDVVSWFENKGVKLKTEEDGRMFPISNSSETIINCFMSESSRLKIRIEKHCEVIALHKESEGMFTLTTQNQEKFKAKSILVANGGSPKIKAYDWLTQLGHSISSPVPSLFTFNDSHSHFKDLMGVATNAASVQIAGTKFKERGPLLITHWGLSGPAVIKLSAWAAEYLFNNNYVFTALVNWLDDKKEDSLRVIFEEQKEAHPKKRIQNDALFGLPSRLWVRLCEFSEIEESKVWSEASKKSLNKLVENLIRCPFQIKGKTTFKEEFVTCGGITLDEIDLETMESKKVPGIYFAGEVLNIDGETGGFNFQAAWTTSYLAARAISTPSNKKTSEAEV